MYLADYCPWDDTGFVSITWVTSPNVIQTADDPDGTMECSLLALHQGATISVTATASGTGLTCSPTTTYYSFVVPYFTSGGLSPSPALRSPSPAPRSPSPAPSSACLKCTAADLTYVAAFFCPSNPTGTITIASVCSTTGLAVTYSAVPSAVLTGGNALSCGQLLLIPGQPVALSYSVSGQVSCSPTSGTITFTAPTVSSPSPSPVSSPKPVPSPSPAPTAACFQCNMGDITADIVTQCAENPLDGVFYFTETLEPGNFCWYTDPGISMPEYVTTPDVQYDALGDAGSCSKAAAYKGQVITLTINVNTDVDPDTTCSPKSSSFNFTMPNF